MAISHNEQINKAAETLGVLPEGVSCLIQAKLLDEDCSNLDQFMERQDDAEYLPLAYLACRFRHPLKDLMHHCCGQGEPDERKIIHSKRDPETIIFYGKVSDVKEYIKDSPFTGANLDSYTRY